MPPLPRTPRAHKWFSDAEELHFLVHRIHRSRPNKAGYILIRTGGPYRHAREHRLKMEWLLGKTHPLTLQSLFGRPVTPLPDGRIPLDPSWEIHHNDYDRSHNCFCNLALFPKAMHRAVWTAWEKQPRSPGGQWGSNDDVPF